MNKAMDEEYFAPSGVDLRETTIAVLKGWPIIVICIAIALWIAIGNLKTATYVYATQMQVTPPLNSEEGQSRLGGAAGAFAAITNISLPTTQTGTQFRLFVDSLTSRDLADELAKNEALMKRLFAGDWDEAAQMWREPPHDPYYEWRVYIRSLIGLRPYAPWHGPGGAELHGYLNTNLEVQQDTRKPYLVRVLFNYDDPQFGIEFLRALSTTADSLLRGKALLRTQLNIDYLSKQLSTVTIVEHRAAITQAMSEQERYAMVASSEAPFAADVFERPWAPNLPSSPRPRNVLTTAILVGAGVGVGLAFGLRKMSAALIAWLRSKLGVKSASGV